MSWTCWDPWGSVNLAELIVPDLNSVICCALHCSLCLWIRCSQWETGLCNFTYFKVLLCSVFKVLDASHAWISCFYWDLRHGLLWKPGSKRNFWSKLKINKWDSLLKEFFRESNLDVKNDLAPRRPKAGRAEPVWYWMCGWIWLGLPHVYACVR